MMPTTRLMQDEILKLKKEKDVCILAHAYQTHDILEVADFVGDSFGLSVKASSAPQKNILMCGVRFMAETAKILSPDKKVILSNPLAGCPMAEQMEVDDVKNLKSKYPDCPVVAYINTTAKLKTECDVCVTSASALKIVKALDAKRIIFIPDCNLGGWVAQQVPDKEFIFVDGGCPVHKQITQADVIASKIRHPKAKLLVHPECVTEVTSQADFAGSTTAIMDYVAKSTDDQFIIGTENSIVQHLQFEYPNKQFFALSPKCICTDMRLTTLADVLNCLNGTGGEEIILKENELKQSKKCIDAMLSYGG